jgi:hypothetical protein
VRGSPMLRYYTIKTRFYQANDSTYTFKRTKQSPWSPGGTLCHACVSRPGLLQKAHRAQRAKKLGGSPAKKARQDPPLLTHLHVSTVAPADLEKGRDDGGSRARSTGGGGSFLIKLTRRGGGHEVLLQQNVAGPAFAAALFVGPAETSSAIAPRPLCAHGGGLGYKS